MAPAGADAAALAGTSALTARWLVNGLRSRLPRHQPIENDEPRPLRVLLVAASQRRLHSYPGMDSKARALMQRMAAALPPAG
jgi:hypothetical protein